MNIGSNLNIISKVDLLDNFNKSINIITNKKEEDLKLYSTKEANNIDLDNKTLPKFEYNLSSNKFGYNDNSKDFFIKVIRNESVSQYPTEEMMRLKGYLISLQTKN